MNTTLFWAQNAVNGLLLGGIYICIALGFSLIWGVLNVMNLAHGSLIVFGATLAWYCFTAFGLSPFLAPFVLMPLMFVLGYALQRVVMSQVIERPVLFTVTLTFGLDLILNNAMIVAFTANFRRVVLPAGYEPFYIFGLTIPRDRLYAMIVALGLTLLLHLFLSASRIGRAIVAVRNDRYAAVLMGVDVGAIYAITFGLGAALAGAAGALMIVVFPISPVISAVFLGKAFVVCVLGGLGSISAIVLGGFALGVIESAGSTLVGPAYPMLIGFAVLLTVLVVKPTGLIGKRGFE